MGSMIQVRHVPEDIHKALKIRAIEKGLSLSDYVLRELVQVVKRPSLDDVLSRIESHDDDRAAIDTVGIIRAERESR